MQVTCIQKELKYFKIKCLVKYHVFYLKSDTLLLVDVFENFRKLCLEIYQLGPSKFLSTSVLTWKQVDCKTTEVKLELPTDIDMLLMVEKEIRGIICHSINRCTATNNKYIKDYYKNKELSYLKYWNVNNLFDWEMS